MDKRISSRGIIIEDDCVYLMFRRRIKEDGSKKEYYVIPGGGINEGETLEENIRREMREEFSVEINILGYLGNDESEDSIANFFACEIASGTPRLGGEELEKCNKLANNTAACKVSKREFIPIRILSYFDFPLPCTLKDCNTSAHSLLSVKIAPPSP